ncbi:unnamed protein product, partial [Rotaria sp. Silwood1]
AIGCFSTHDAPLYRRCLDTAIGNATAIARGACLNAIHACLNPTPILDPAANFIFIFIIIIIIACIICAIICAIVCNVRNAAGAGVNYTFTGG